MKRALIAVLPFAAIMFIGWCGGVEFDHRSLELGVTVGVGLFLSGIAFVAMYLAENDELAELTRSRRGGKTVEVSLDNLK